MYNEKNDGKARLEHNKPYDDPYGVLANHIIAYTPPKVIIEMLKKDSLIRKAVVNEAKALDISGHFLDCIDEEIIRKRHIRDKNKQLKKLGIFYFSELDIARLRAEIRGHLKDFGIDIEE